MHQKVGHVYVHILCTFINADLLEILYLLAQLKRMFTLSKNKPKHFLRTECNRFMCRGWINMHSILCGIILKLVTNQQLNYGFSMKLQLNMWFPPRMWWHINGRLVVSVSRQHSGLIFNTLNVHDLMYGSLGVNALCTSKFLSF